MGGDVYGQASPWGLIYRHGACSKKKKQRWRENFQEAVFLTVQGVFDGVAVAAFGKKISPIMQPAKYHLPSTISHSKWVEHPFFRQRGGGGALGCWVLTESHGPSRLKHPIAIFTPAKPGLRLESIPFQENV